MASKNNSVIIDGQLPLNQIASQSIKINETDESCSQVSMSF